jgi:hypothetical protein
MNLFARQNGKLFATNREYNALAVKAKSIIGKKTRKITSAKIVVVVIVISTCAYKYIFFDPFWNEI